MLDHWEVYFSEIEGQDTSILVDMEVTEEIEVEAYPVAIIVRLALKNPDDNGFPNVEEADILEVLEEQLLEQLEKHNILTPGRMTSNGARELVYYAKENVAEILVEVCEQIVTPKGYAFDIIELQEDEPWEFYFNVLYPNQYEQQHIGNRWVTNQLEEHGDRANVPREITHALYFEDMKLLKKFLKTVKKEGFTPAVESAERTEEGYYACEIHHIEEVELPIINNVTDYLITVAENYEGIYDGWETSVIK